MTRRTWIGVTGMVAALALLATVAFSGNPATAAEGSKAAPAFTLTDTHGKTHSLADFKGKWVVLEWVNHGCPFVKKFYGADKMQEWQVAYTEKGVVWLSICSSASGKQGHMTAEQWNKTIADTKTKATAVLLDADGTVGKAYNAKTTPHMFVISPEGEIVYQGAIDSKRSANAGDIATATNYVQEVLDAVLAGKPSPHSQTTPYGCSVKY